MRVLHASHIANYTPPAGYGGVELMVDTLAKEQVARGYDVLVLGVKPDDVLTPYEVKAVFRRPIKKPLAWHKVYYFLLLASISRDFDVVHMHVQWLTPIASIIKSLHGKTVLLTLHADPSNLIAHLGVPLIAISETQRRRLESKGIKIATVIYNGIDVDKYPFRSEKEDFFVYLGRIDETKGLHVAIEAVRKSREKLVIIGPVTNYNYFNSYVKPFIDNKNVIYLGEVDFESKVEYLSKAKALLYPVQYEEFFGIAMVEALATGTPVIGFPRGSVTEIVKDGVTGYLVRDVEEMCKAMRAVDKLDREGCRRDAEERFSSKVMVKHYEELYRRPS